ncbi:hypothetical protein LEP1GSC202_0388 [Leptospira yanagawae serovar Saopaulo str. Sao Paulo = ATCC 700523]|uniref:Uncharacterized protein n=2 Tax=Leptospira yanagawae TaxID=293069 RepID=A0A5E8H9M4_9LEPT|nr:hypothetical protein LEP1GSC202_0388 [Leptospira yanagawae serovar Saopaulo str. Sao Paulo = ATCC 700523]
MPEASGNDEIYISEDAVIRIFPDVGILIDILLDYEISDKYGKIKDVYNDDCYEFYVNFNVVGMVNVTTDEVTFYSPKKIQFKYGIIKKDGKWKISLDSYGPFPLPKKVFQTYFLNKNKPDIANKFE